MKKNSNHRVLIVEADPANQKVTFIMLKKLGYEADMVSNGMEALHSLKCNQYDLVLMNMMMPVMDGLTAAKEIRKSLSGSRQPKIIALTACMLSDSRERCIEAGMDDYISKPVTIRHLSEVLARHL